MVLRESWLHKTEEHPPTAPVPLSAPLNPLPQPDWQHQLWPLPAPKASGQWSILVPRVAGEPRKDRGRSWPGSSRLDGEGHQGGSLGQLGGGRVLTAVGAGGGGYSSALISINSYLSGFLNLGREGLYLKHLWVALRPESYDSGNPQQLTLDPGSSTAPSPSPRGGLSRTALCMMLSEAGAQASWGQSGARVCSGDPL